MTAQGLNAGLLCAEASPATRAIDCFGHSIHKIGRKAWHAIDAMTAR